MTKTLLAGMSREEMAQTLAEIGEKPFRLKQLWHWVYHQGATDFDSMTTLSKDFRKKLAEDFSLIRPTIVKEQLSTDKSRKWLVRYDDGAEIETVFIPEEDRGALCISTQAGCQAGCAFCSTGSQGFVRDLTAAEIVGQFMLARDAYGEWPTPTGEDGRLLSNVVVMGMGEPLFNYDNTVKALKILMDQDGISISKRRITLSTCGVVPYIRRAAHDLGVKLAVSLHAATDEIRDQIMPINRKYPIAELMAACREYREISGMRQYVTFEYVMLKGINDSIADAKELIKKCKGIGAKFNLIPFNPWAGSKFECSSPSTIKKFAQTLEEAGFAAPIRVSRGQDISAACGQLRAENSCRRSRSKVGAGEDGAS